MWQLGVVHNFPEPAQHCPAVSGIGPVLDMHWQNREPVLWRDSPVNIVYFGVCAPRPCLWITTITATTLQCKWHCHFKNQIMVGCYRTYSRFWRWEWSIKMSAFTTSFTAVSVHVYPFNIPDKYQPIWVPWSRRKCYQTRCLFTSAAKLAWR